MDGVENGEDVGYSNCVGFLHMFQVVSGPACPGIPSYPALPGGGGSYGHADARFRPSLLLGERHWWIEVGNWMAWKPLNEHAEALLSTQILLPPFPGQDSDLFHPKKKLPSSSLRWWSPPVWTSAPSRTISYKTCSRTSTTIRKALEKTTTLCFALLSHHALGPPRNLIYHAWFLFFVAMTI